MTKVDSMHLKRMLAEVNYPTNKHDLIKHAELTGIEEKILRQFKHLPDRQYETLENVRQAMTEIEKQTSI